MVQPLAKWLQLRYASLWKEFGSNKFTFDEAQKLLKDNTQTLNVVISEMKSAGCIDVSVDNNDKRKRLYKLISPKDMMENLEA